MDRVKQIATEVNDPAHPSYGQFLTRAEIAALTAPAPDDLRTVAEWLAGHGDVSVDSSVKEYQQRAAGATLKLRTTAKAAGALLGGTTFFHWFNPVTKQRAVRAGDVRIPVDVGNALQAVYGVHGLPAPPRPAALGQVPKPEWGPAPEQAPVTPAVLRARYGVDKGGVAPTGSTVNRQAVAEFQGQQMNATDLKNFFAKFVPDAAPGDDTVFKYVGSGGAQASSGGIEASLDIQYIMGVAPHIKTEFWYYGSNDFCGDMKTWTGHILSDDGGPNVHSVSYGFQANITAGFSAIGCTSISEITDIDNQFAKIATTGVSIMLASGDSGSGWAPPQAKCDASDEMSDTVLTGTVREKVNVRKDMIRECCSRTNQAGAAGWSWSPPPPPASGTHYGTCQSTNPGELKDTVFTGNFFKLFADSAAHCCDEVRGTSQNSVGWSYVPPAGGGPGNGNCLGFSKITGKKTIKGAESHKGPMHPPVGTCTLFSSISGKKTSSGCLAGLGPKKDLGVRLFPSWPAISPWVTSVGATRFLDASTTIGEEMAVDGFGSGGGFSWNGPAFKAQTAAVAAYLKAAPQLPPAGSFPAAGRATPDVSALGEGYQVVQGASTTSVAGTSASAPTFSAIVSMLNEARIQAKMKPMGFFAPFAYANPHCFNDVTVGTNAIGRGTGPTPYGFNCTKGWDPATGVGTPIFSCLLKAALAAGKQE
jgi:hypothetical protein